MWYLTFKKFISALKIPQLVFLAGKCFDLSTNMAEILENSNLHFLCIPSVFAHRSDGVVYIVPVHLS